MIEFLNFYMFDVMTTLHDLATGRVRSSFAHLSKSALWALVATALFVTALPFFALAQLPGPKFPGSTAPSSPTTPVPKAPNITPLTKEFIAEPFTVTMQPARLSPFYIPGASNCPPQTLRFDSKGGYAPVTWQYTDPSLTSYWSGLEGFELVDPTGKTGLPPAPTTLLRKPATPSTRLLRFNAFNANDGGEGREGGVPRRIPVTVYAVDGSGKKQGATFVVLPTRACGAPALSGASESTGGATGNTLVSQKYYPLQTANFDTRDNNRDPTRMQETRIGCGYPSGLRVNCFENFPDNDQLATSFRAHCPSVSPCRIRAQNLEGSGTIQVRLVNPYGVSAALALDVTFPSAVRTETETFVLPSTIAQEPATVQAGPDLPDYMGDALPPCPSTYLVWRGLTFSDPSGRAKLERPIKVGARVSQSTLPQWKIAPGSNQISIQVNYEVERRHAICPGLVIQ